MLHHFNSFKKHLYFLLSFIIITLAIPLPSLLSEENQADTNEKKIELISPLNYEGEEAGRYTRKGDFIIVENPRLLDAVKRIDEIGQLQIKKNGFVYLNVDDRMIELAQEHLELTHPAKSVIDKNKAMGAHISVMNDSETKKRKITSLDEVGQWFTYEIKDLYYIDRVNKKKHQRERLWVLGVESQGLERLRMKYEMKPLLQGHNFHITLFYEYIDEAEIEIEEAA
jgi:hypothetical protein